jgi:hypothetical protein
VAEERRQRILNARSRLIGLDVGALDAQVAEMKAKREQDNEQAKNECTKIINYYFHRADFDQYVYLFSTVLRMQEIQNLLEQAYEEERLLKKMQNDEVKQTWEMQKAAREAERQRKPDIAIDRDNAGLSAAVAFVGEDNLRDERVRRQKDQMKTWVQQQVSEKMAMRAAAKAEDEEYANMVRAIEGIRDASEREELDMRRMVQRSVNDENKLVRYYDHIVIRCRYKYKINVHFIRFLCTSYPLSLYRFPSYSLARRSP